MTDHIRVPYTLSLEQQESLAVRVRQLFDESHHDLVTAIDKSCELAGAEITKHEGFGIDPLTIAVIAMTIIKLLIYLYQNRPRILAPGVTSFAGTSITTSELSIMESHKSLLPRPKTQPGLGATQE